MPRIPVSRPLDWNAAQDRWLNLDNARRDAVQGTGRYPTTGQPRDHYPDVPVRYFAVRAADDPNWPADEASYPRLRGLVRGTAGRFI
jgi:hypothetical protein